MLRDLAAGSLFRKEKKKAGVQDRQPVKGLHLFETQRISSSTHMQASYNYTQCTNITSKFSFHSLMFNFHLDPVTVCILRYDMASASCRRPTSLSGKTESEAVYCATCVCASDTGGQSFKASLGVWRRPAPSLAALYSQVLAFYS